MTMNLVRKNVLCRIALVLLLAPGCGGNSGLVNQPPVSPPPSAVWPLTDSQVQNLLSKKYFFGHQSVGGNILQGISDLI